MNDESLTSKVALYQNLDQNDHCKTEGLNQVLDSIGFFSAIKPKDRVLIKPNFVAPSEKATTDLTLLRGIIIAVKNSGAIPIVAESSGYEFSTEYTVKILKIRSLCSELDAVFYNLDDGDFAVVPSGNPNVPEYKIASIVYQVDKIIDMPCFKGHTLTKVTFGIKNLFGLLHHDTRRDIHITGLEFGISKLAELVRIDFSIVSGIWNVANAVFGYAEYLGLIIGGNNVYEVDAVCCRIAGVDYNAIPHIALGNHVKNDALLIYVTDISIPKNAMFVGDSSSFRKYIYKMIFVLDKLAKKVGITSTVSFIHYYMGIRPVIKKSMCVQCKKCEEACPIHAINNMRIDSHKCMKARCMKCIEVCPHKAIVCQGFHRS